ncbi:facilitated trehalose transporter Tret1-like isoform X2 [Anticarsia gemmatalis]
MASEKRNVGERKGTTYKQWLAALTANTTLLTYGFQSGWVAPMTSILQSEESPAGTPLNDTEMSWVASSISLFACLGVPLFAYTVDKIGRKKTILIMAVFQTLCWIINILSSSTASLIIGRFFGGLSSGGCYNVVPMYVREISQDDIRGILGSFLILLQNIGFLVMFAMGFYMDYYVVLYIVVWIPVITIVMMLFAPESPAFLVKKGLNDEAASTLSVLRGLDVDDKVIQKELDYMKNEEETYKSLPTVSFLNIWQNKTWRHGCYLNIALVTLRANSGNFAILTFTPAILAASGVTVNRELQTLSFPAVMILASFISMSCVEKFGRKPLLASTFIVGGIALGTLATTMLIQQQGGAPPVWIPALAIIIYLCSYAGGISPMPYIIMAEMFNFQIRAKVIGAFVTHAWFLSFLQIVTFTAITNLIGAHNVFYCYAVTNILGAFVTLIFLPETKGKTVEEIEMDLNKRR